jgi:hypothetical protein
MISKRLLWFIALSLAALLALAWWGKRYPARVTIINTSGVTIGNVDVRSGEQRASTGPIPNGGSRSVTLAPGETVMIHFARTTWRSPEELTPARAMIVYIRPEGRITTR